MSNFISFVSISLATAALVACGNGTNNQASTAGTYGYNQGPVRACPPGLVQQWSTTVSPACSQPGPNCAQVAQGFLSQYQATLQGNGCSASSGGSQVVTLNAQTIQNLVNQSGSGYQNQQPYYQGQPVPQY